MNKRGQFSIIAALLVAIVLITTVVMTYSTIRSSNIRGQPKIQSAIDETNLAIKQILGFTVGYYGSVLKSTGNQTYATQLAMDYLQSGLVYTASMHPDWGASFNVTSSKLYTYWYANLSYSSGDLSVSYNLKGLGIYGIVYDTSCSLTVQVMPTVNNQAILSITKDGTEPLVNLDKSNLNFYCYEANDSLWHLVEPPNEPTSYSNGTYQMDIPSGVDVNSYLIQAEDQRGILVVASSYSAYAINLAWNVLNGTSSLAQHFVDNNSSDVDSSPNIGTHGNFTAMQNGSDGVLDTLTEGIKTAAAPETWVSPFQYEGSGWTNPSYAYDNNNLTAASESIQKNKWSDDLILDTSAVNCHKIRYLIVWDSGIDRIRVSIDNGSLTTVYNGNGAGMNNVLTNLSFSETSVTKMQFNFHNGDNKADHNAYVYEAQFLQSATPQNCQLDLEAQWTNVNFTQPNQWLCIYGGTMASEDTRVDVRSGSTWLNLFTDLTTGWNNISVSQYVNSPTFTIRFKDGTQTNDPSQDSWQIDTALLRSGLSIGNSTSGPIVIELLQNGTMRWLGSTLQLTMLAKPIPPVAVRAIHINETIANISREVPFQIEDWASNYQIPLGLTNNASVFGRTNMIVFIANSTVSQMTLWWNGSDTSTQTPYAYKNIYFNDDVANGIFRNDILTLTAPQDFTQVRSTVNTLTATASFMRINGAWSGYGSMPTYVIFNGTVRDIIHQEAEFGGGVTNCPNFYTDIVLTLPANVNYYTYQLRIMFINSTQPRTITDLCPVRLSVPTGQPQTENDVSSGYPIVSSAPGLYYNKSASESTHHWSEFISGTKGAGIMFTGAGNQQLYVFDSIAGNSTGALSVTNSTGNLIALQPVSTMKSVNFANALDVVWTGAIATFDGTDPIYNNGVSVAELWKSVESLPIITVSTS